MGRPSPETKRRKRQRQKVRRQLKFSSKSSNDCTSELDEYVVGRVLPDEIGEDTDVMQMKLEDVYQQWDDSKYTHKYLMECRQQLIKKIEEYRCKLEQLQTQNSEMTLKHRKEIEEIRTFYRNIAYGTSRSGKIVKKAMSFSDAAKEVLKAIGYQELQRRLAMYSD